MEKYPKKVKTFKNKKEKNLREWCDDKMKGSKRV